MYRRLTVIVECGCEHCVQYADRKDLGLPLRAEEVNVEVAAAAICGTAKGLHSVVQKAYQLPFGRVEPMQEKFGPWVA
ncbi:hypothetical protein ACFS27_05035 [Promicromonospora vindobonensis]|uniref:Uncharacterized protein n=1 Tax=Promicromonospora vindobonensis TaxID=195748 RepID=A0ABW5VR52_9MICO